jgi:hypothetical protein
MVDDGKEATSVNNIKELNEYNIYNYTGTPATNLQGTNLQGTNLQGTNLQRNQQTCPVNIKQEGGNSNRYCIHYKGNTDCATNNKGIQNFLCKRPTDGTVDKECLKYFNHNYGIEGGDQNTDIKMNSIIIAIKKNPEVLWKNNQCKQLFINYIENWGLKNLLVFYQKKFQSLVSDPIVGVGENFQDAVEIIKALRNLVEIPQEEEQYKPQEEEQYTPQEEEQYTTVEEEYDSFCKCADTKYGCCPDGVIAKKHKYDNCCTVEEEVVSKKMVGGCSGTQFGCCPDGITAKQNIGGTNCNISGCSTSQFGCCADGITARCDSIGSNCNQNPTEIPDTGPYNRSVYVYDNRNTKNCPKCPNMDDYIKKDEIPCWGCNLK